MLRPQRDKTRRLEDFIEKYPGKTNGSSRLLLIFNSADNPSRFPCAGVAVKEPILVSLNILRPQQMCYLHFRYVAESL
jgi:hypothetical protein